MANRNALRLLLAVFIAGASACATRNAQDYAIVPVPY